jgi:hypothetical protein
MKEKEANAGNVLAFFIHPPFTFPFGEFNILTVERQPFEKSHYLSFIPINQS